jgi:hypothetical protein
MNFNELLPLLSLAGSIKGMGTSSNSTGIRFILAVAKSTNNDDDDDDDDDADDDVYRATSLRTRKDGDTISLSLGRKVFTGISEVVTVDTYGLYFGIVDGTVKACTCDCETCRTRVTTEMIARTKIERLIL